MGLSDNSLWMNDVCMHDPVIGVYSSRKVGSDIEIGSVMIDDRTEAITDLT